MRTEVLPPSAAAPAAARAGEMVAAHEAKPDIAARAQMSVALQQNVGNARMGAMVAPPAPKHGAKEAPHPAPHEASKDAEKAPVKAVAPADAKPAQAKAAEAAHAKGGAEKKAPAKGGPSAKQAIAPAIQAVRHRAGQARKHTPVGSVVANTQAAAISPKTDQTRGGAVQTVDNLHSASAKAEPVPRSQFRMALRKAIDNATRKPTTEAEADHVMKEGAKNASHVMSKSVGAQRDAAAGPVKVAANSEAPSLEPEPQKTDLKPETVGAPPAAVSAAPVVPAPLPPERLDYSSDRASTDNAMEESHISKDQLAKGNEPAFKTTLDARSTAETHEANAEAKYRKEEANVQGQAHTAAAGALAGGLGGIHGLRGLHVGNVAGHQSATQKKHAQERQRITDAITRIKDAAKGDVDKILKKMEDDAGPVFEKALSDAEQAYADTFEEAKGGLFTRLTTWHWERHIENSLATAREEYLRQVRIGIDDVANLVDAALDAAKKRVGDGRKEVDDFVQGLHKSVRGFGMETQESVSADFDAMSSEIDQRGDQLVDKLTAQYKASYERMSAKEEALREANKSLWQRVYDATVGLIKKIIAFKDMLVNVLRKAADAVLDIISDPIGFLGNLVEGVMNGLRNFMKNIAAHLKRGLMEWLFGALAGAGLKMPEEFDLKGIVSIVLQVLGLTKDNFRARAVLIVGENVVAGIEQTAKIFQIIATDGVAGLWDFIKEKVDNLKSMVLDAVFDYVKERVLVAGVTWIISLLNPASAFFKACKAIYDIVKFFIERGSEILALINAIIDSIAAIAKGQLDTAAKWVEEALAKTIPLAIGFLASLLNLGDVGETVKKTIDKAQEPVNKAIDWAIHQAVKLTKFVAKTAKAGVSSLFSWAFATSKFKDDEGKTHSLYVNEEGKITIASTPQAAKEFVDFYVGKHKDKEKFRGEINALIDQAQKIADTISKAKGDEVPEPAKQKELLKLSLQISEKLSELVAGDRTVGKLEQKYLLEGQVGTWATMPKPFGDQLTPDHQPQASIIMGAADFFSEKKFDGGELAKRAKGRADKGYAINLHFKRHVAGATYGSKGETQDGFHAKLKQKAGHLPKDEATVVVVNMLRTALDKDVQKMKEVAKEGVGAEPWKQLEEETGKDEAGKKKAEALKEQIADRIDKGENQIASQPFDF